MAYLLELLDERLAGPGESLELCDGDAGLFREGPESGALHPSNTTRARRAPGSTTRPGVAAATIVSPLTRTSRVLTTCMPASRWGGLAARCGGRGPRD